MNIWKTQDFLVSKGRKMRLNHERSFFENRKNCSPSELHGGSLFRTFNSYSFNFNGGLRKRCTGLCLLRSPSPRGKQFLWFLKIDLLRFHRIYLLFDWSNLLVFELCLLRINLPKLCPNMIHGDALDFSEWHSEEVISFFWRSVYILAQHWTITWKKKKISVPVSDHIRQCDDARQAANQLGRHPATASGPVHIQRDVARDSDEVQWQGPQTRQGFKPLPPDTWGAEFTPIFLQ